MNVRQCMTADVRLVLAHDSIRDAAHMMKKADTGALPVSEDGRLVGMITDRDIAIRAVAVGKGVDTPIREVMSDDLQYCFDDEELDSVAQKMGKLKVRRLAVLNRDKRLVGMISIGDLIRQGDGAQGADALRWVSQPHGPHKHA